MLRLFHGLQYKFMKARKKTKRAIITRLQVTWPIKISPTNHNQTTRLPILTARFVFDFLRNMFSFLLDYRQFTPLLLSCTHAKGRVQSNARLSLPCACSSIGTGVQHRTLQLVAWCSCWNEQWTVDRWTAGEAYSFDLSNFTQETTFWRSLKTEHISRARFSPEFLGLTLGSN